MLNIYYKIWVDAIVFEKTKNGQRRNWKMYTLIPISLFQGINLLTILTIVSALTNIKLNLFFDITFFGVQSLNAFFSFSITFFFPFILLNYFLIIYNNRYESLIKEYKYYNGKLYLTYFLFTIGVVIIPIFIGIIFGL